MQTLVALDRIGKGAVALKRSLEVRHGPQVTDGRRRHELGGRLVVGANGPADGDVGSRPRDPAALGGAGVAVRVGHGVQPVAQLDLMRADSGESAALSSS